MLTFPGTCSNILIVLVSVTNSSQNTMREWLSGGAPPCQGGGRGFDSRLALFYCKKGISDGDALFCNREAEASQPHLLHKWVRISPAGSVGAKQVPPAPSTSSRAVMGLEV